MTRFPAATSSDQTLYAALELSKNSWLLAIQFPDRDNPSLHPIKGGDADGLIAKLDAARERLAKVSGQVPKVILCYEAGYDGFWLARFLELRGVDCRVMASLRVDINSSAQILDSVIRNSNAGIHVYNASSASLVRTTVEDNTVHGLEVDLSSSARIEDSTIDSNGSGIKVGLNSAVTLLDNTITNNTNDGVLVRWQGGLATAAAPNTIQGNGGVDVRCESRGIILVNTQQTSDTKTTDIAGDCLLFGDPIFGVPPV